MKTQLEQEEVPTMSEALEKIYNLEREVEALRRDNKWLQEAMDKYSEDEILRGGK